MHDLQCRSEQGQSVQTLLWSWLRSPSSYMLPQLLKASISIPRFEESCSLWISIEPSKEVMDIRAPGNRPLSTSLQLPLRRRWNVAASHMSTSLLSQMVQSWARAPVVCRQDMVSEYLPKIACCHTDLLGAIHGGLIGFHRLQLSKVEFIEGLDYCGVVICLVLLELDIGIAVAAAWLHF